MKPMKAKRPKRQPSPPASREALLWLLAVAVASILPHVGHLPIWQSAIIASILIWRYYAWWKKRPNPPRAVIVLVVIACLAAVLFEYRTLFGRDAGVALLSLFTILKFMEIRTRRDATLVIMLGYFLLLTHYLYSQDLLTGLWMLLSATVVTGALIRLNGGIGSIRETLFESGRLLAQAIPFMLILFILFPRIPGPLWNLPQDANAGLTGLSDSMSPGSLDQLIKSNAIAFRALFREASPARANLYWRGPVFDYFDGKTWNARPSFLSSPSRIEPVGKPVSYSITMEGNGRNWLLPLDAPTQLPSGASLDGRLVAVTSMLIKNRTLYEWVSASDYRANVKESNGVLRQSLRLPDTGNTRARQLAQQWAEQGGGPEAIAGRVLAYFRQENFVYTLQPPLLGDQPVDEFLFGTRRGFCEHYSSAFVFLMRAAGVPARVVTGYQGGEENPVDGYVVVRQSDAHAWAEIWAEGRGWLRYDPTAAIAPSRIEAGLASAVADSGNLPFIMRGNYAWARQVLFRWEALNNTWNQLVLGYNDVQQKEFLARLGLSNPDWKKMLVVLAVFCSLFGLIFLYWALRQPVERDQLERNWRALLARLQKMGIDRPDWEGPRALTERIRQEYPDHPEVAAIVDEASRHYIAARYGHGDAEASQVIRVCRKRLSGIGSISKT